MRHRGRLTGQKQRRAANCLEVGLRLSSLQTWCRVETQQACAAVVQRLCSRVINITGPVQVARFAVLPWCQITQHDTWFWGLCVWFFETFSIRLKQQLPPCQMCTCGPIWWLRDKVFSADGQWKPCICTHVSITHPSGQSWGLTLS